MARREEIARGLKQPLRAVRVEPHHTKRVDLAVIAVTPNDPFKQRHDWAGPHKPGETIAEGIGFATSEDSERVEVYLAGNTKLERNGQHHLVMGISGSGKSKAWQAIYGSALCRRDVCIILADPAKGLHFAGPLIEGVTWFIDNDTAAGRLLKRIPQLIIDRQNWLTDRGLDEWEPGCGLEYLVIHFEEAAGLARYAFIKLAERARSAGIDLVLSLQRASGDRINTSVRYNLGASMCFGTRDLVDSRFALMEQTILAGANPHTWQNRKRGQFYFESDGIDPAKFSIPNKTDFVTTAAIREAVASGAKYRMTVSDVTAKALGHEFAEYHRDKIAGRKPWLKRDSGLVVPTPEPATQRVAVAVANGVNDDRVTTKAANAILASWLEEKRANGETSFTFTEAKAELLPRVERSATWLNLRLARLIKMGLLPDKEADNNYRL